MSKFKANTKIWTNYILSRFGNKSMIIDYGSLNEIINMILNETSEWNQTPRYSEQRQLAIMIKTASEEDNMYSNETLFMHLINGLLNIFERYTIGDPERIIYNLLHKSFIIRQALKQKYQKQTKKFKVQLGHLFIIISKQQQLSQQKLEYLRNICLNHEYQVSEMLGHEIIHYEKARKTMFQTQLCLNIPTAMGWDSKFYNGWDKITTFQPEIDEDRNNLNSFKLVLQNCTLGTAKINKSIQKTKILQLLDDNTDIIPNTISPTQFLHSVSNFANNKSEFATFKYHFSFDANGHVLMKETDNNCYNNVKVKPRARKRRRLSGASSEVSTNSSLHSVYSKARSLNYNHRGIIGIETVSNSNSNVVSSPTQTTVSNFASIAQTTESINTDNNSSPTVNTVSDDADQNNNDVIMSVNQADDDDDSNEDAPRQLNPNHNVNNNNLEQKSGGDDNNNNPQEQKVNLFEQDDNFIAYGHIFRQYHNRKTFNTKVINHVLTEMGTSPWNP